VESTVGGILADWLTEDEVAAETGKRVRTLRSWRKLGKGPPFTRFGRTIKYRRDSLVAYFKAQEETPVRKRHPRSERPPPLSR
jgi:hypothetical protein